MAKPKAYSYIRFSSLEQSKGDSSRRQLELSQKFAFQYGLDLDKSLTFQDLGVSAFRGKNATEGNLKAFIDAIERKLVKRGSYLLVESLDRLSRDKVHQAYIQFTGILNLGVNIATLTDNKIYTIDSLNENFSDLLISLATMFRAHEESSTKSKRIKASWKAKRKLAQEDGKKLTSRCPAWMKLNKEKGEFELIEAKAKVVKRIFKMALEGIGKATIARRFNEEGVPTFGKSIGWQDSYIQKILENEAVIGNFQPMKVEVKANKKTRVPDGEPIENYFPCVVDKKTHIKAKAIRKSRKISSGRKGDKFSNLFSGLSYCGGCGLPMHFLNKGEGNMYLVCSGANRKTTACEYFSWNYKSIEKFLILSLLELDFKELYPNIYQGTKERLTNLEDSMLIKREDLSKANKLLNNVTNLIVEKPDSKALKVKLDDLESNKDILEKEIETLKEQIEEEDNREQEVSHNFTESREAMKHWIELQRSNDIGKAYNERAKLNQLLKRVANKIHFLPGRIAKNKKKLASYGKEYGDFYGMIKISFINAKTINRIIGIYGKQKYSVSYKEVKGKIEPDMLSEMGKKSLSKS